MEEVEQMEDGSWRTRSVLEFVAGDGDEVVVECHAKHEVLGDGIKTGAHRIKIGEGRTIMNLSGILSTPADLILISTIC